MASTWMLQRFRTTFLRENIVLLVLMMLRDSEMTEWEMLNSLHARYGFTPSLAEFRRTSNFLVKRGFVKLETAEDGGCLRMTEDGLKLLERLQEEYRAIVACAYPRQGSVLTK